MSPRRFIGLICACAVLAACSGTTNGSGSASRAPATTSSSTPDFPSNTGAQPTDTAQRPSAPASGSGSDVHPAPAQPVRTATAHAPDGTTYQIDIWADVHDDTCFDHAYGAPMIAFLTEHPCRGMERYLATTTVGGRAVGFAETVTSFAGTAKDPYVYSNKFTQLENADGTGSIDDLLREGYRLPSGPTEVPSSEAFNVLGQDNGVTVWDVWYLDGPTPNQDKTLIKMTQDVFLQF